MAILRSRNRSACALLVVGGALAATLLGAGVSQAQQSSTYPDPALAYYQSTNARLQALPYPAFAYCPTTSSYTWGGGGLSTVCGSGGSTTPASTTPAPFYRVRRPRR